MDTFKRVTGYFCRVGLVYSYLYPNTSSKMTKYPFHIILHIRKSNSNPSTYLLIYLPACLPTYLSLCVSIYKTVIKT